MAGRGRWQRSSACSDGNCVEVSVDAGVVLVRSSVEPDVALPLTADQWRSLLDAVKSDEFVPEQRPESAG